jgi:DNA-binding TFAR19-related protein (PDSD5 family)
LTLANNLKLESHQSLILASTYGSPNAHERVVLSEERKMSDGTVRKVLETSALSQEDLAPKLDQSVLKFAKVPTISHVVYQTSDANLKDIMEGLTPVK